MPWGNAAGCLVPLQQSWFPIMDEAFIRKEQYLYVARLKVFNDFGLQMTLITILLFYCCFISVPPPEIWAHTIEGLPITLPSVVMKSVEWSVLLHLRTLADPLMDPLQFIYRATMPVDDAVNLSLYFILQHLDSLGSCSRIPWGSWWSLTCQRQCWLTSNHQVHPHLRHHCLVCCCYSCQYCCSISTALQRGWLATSSHLHDTGTPPGPWGDQERLLLTLLSAVR